MIYLIYGTEEYLINSHIDSIIKKNMCDVTLKYYYPDTEIDSVIEEINYPSLFGDKKAVILYNCKFLSHEKDESSFILEKYIDNQNEDGIFILVLEEEKLDERKKITKKLKEKAEIKCFNKLKGYEINNFVNEYIKENGYEIQTSLVSEIISRVGTNLRMIISEIDKMFLYKEDKIITLSDIENVVSISLENDIYKLINSVTNENIGKMLSYYNDLIKMGNHPSLILMLIANQFRLIYQVKVLLNDGYKENDIIKELESHPYQIKLALEKSYNFSEKKILNILYELSLIDENIKNNKIDINSSLENFFLNLCN